MSEETKAGQSARAIATMREALGVYGDACLGIEGQELNEAERLDFNIYVKATHPPRLELRITRRNNVVAEVNGRVLAMAHSTHGIKGRKARRESAEQFIERFEQSKALTAEDILGMPRHPRFTPMEN